MELLTQNSKLKKTSDLNGIKIMNFGITAGLACPQAGACAKFCYAKKGAYSWGNVSPAFKKRYDITKQDNFTDLMTAEIIKKKVDMVRIHDSGDFYNKEYLDKWLSIIVLMPDVSFYAYTKSLHLFKGLKLPKNFVVIYSEGGKLDAMIDVKKDRHSRIFKTEHELITAGYANASKDDMIAVGKNKKIGLIIH